MTEAISIETIEELARQYGYWTVFIGISLENAGIPLPGETITLVGGFLAGEGELEYKWVLAAAISGAILGDNCGYWLGRLGGWSMLVRIAQWFRIEEERLEGVRSQFSDNAAKAVFFGRFIALLRIFAGPLAGIVGMPYGKFFLCNAAGAALWALIMVSLAFFVGAIVPLEQLISWVAQFGIGALVVVIGLVAFSLWLEARQKKLPSD